MDFCIMTLHDTNYNNKPLGNKMMKKKRTRKEKLNKRLNIFMTDKLKHILISLGLHTDRTKQFKYF